MGEILMSWVAKKSSLENQALEQSNACGCCELSDQRPFPSPKLHLTGCPGRFPTYLLQMTLSPLRILPVTCYREGGRGKGSFLERPGQGSSRESCLSAEEAREEG